MNTQYRLVWNKSLRVVQVASELAHRPDGGVASAAGATVTQTSCALALKGLSFAAWVALGLVSVIAPASAGQVAGLITSDPNAPGNQRPTVLGSPGNAALVNITTPSAKGVSTNQYSAFQVDSHGAVLNNSRTNTQTTLAGTIGGNPYLATGTARVIVNQVNGSSPAALGGYIEVAGDKAQVVIASPAGIAVDGGGFLNASRVTLTTGTPVLNGGALEGYRVSGNGVVQVTGNGLDASRADYTDIIARAAVLEGAIYAQQLQATLGANQVSADQSQITSITGVSTKPALALDTSALGGMYANKIVLLANEQGVGVKNAGTIAASVGDVIVTVDGRLENTGHLQSGSGDTTIIAGGGVSNAGVIAATNTLAISTPQDVDNSNGTLNAGRIAVDAASLRNAAGTIAQTGLRGMSLQAGAISNRNGGSIGMPVADTGAGAGGPSSSGGSPTPPATDPSASTGGSTGSSDAGSSGTPPVASLADGVLHITGLLDNDGGRISAAAGFDLTSANGLSNDGGQLGLRQLTLTGGDLSNRGGTLAINGAASIQGGNVLNDAGQLSFANSLAFNVQNLSNRGGTFTHSGTDATALSVAGTLDNTGGTLTSNASSLAITSGTLINEGGAISHTGLDGLTVTTNALYGAGGKIATAGAVQLTAGAIDHQQATLAATQVTVNAASFDNRGGTITASGDAANTLQVTGMLDNSDGGTLASNADLSLHAGTLGNANGTVQHAGTGTLRIDAATLNGAGGTIGSNGQLLLTGATTDLSGGTTSAQAVSITTGSLSTAHGTLVAAGSSLLQLTVQEAYDNTGGQVSTNGALQLSAASLTNAGGSLVAAGTGATHLTVTNRLDNTGGTLAAAGATTVQAHDLINQGGTLQAAGAALTVTADGLLDNSAKGFLTSDGDLTLGAATLDNTAGTIQHTGQGAATITATMLNGQGGTIASNGDLTLHGGALNLSDGTTYAQRVTVNADALTTAGGTLQALGDSPLNLTVRGLFDNTAGTVATNGALQLTAQTLTNTQGTLSAAGHAATSLTVAGRFDNTGGTLAAMGATTVTGGDLVNQGGTIQAAGSLLTVTTHGLLDNSQHGTLASDGDLTVSASTLDNTQGVIQHAGQGGATITATTLNGQGGTIASNGDLTLHGGALNLRDGTIYAQSVTVNADALTTAGSTLQALGGSPLNLTVRGLLDNTGGQIATNGALQLTAQALTNANGTLQAAGTDATVLTVTQAFDNTLGTLATAGATRVHAGSLDNTAGTLQAASDDVLTVSSDGALINDGGTLVGNGALALSAGSLSNHGGTIQTQQAIDATIGGTFDNSNGGTVTAGGDLTVQAASLLNRNTLSTSVPQGLYGDHVHLQADTLDNTQGQIHANDTLTVQGQSASASAVTNAGGAMDGTDAVTVIATTLDNTGGQLIQRGSDGSLSLNATQAITNTGGGLIGAEGTASIHAGAFDNSGGTTSAQGDLSLASDGDLFNRNGGVLQTHGALTLNANGTFDNSAGQLDAAGAAAITAASVNNVGGQLLAGDASSPDAALQIISGSTLDNRGGTIGNRGGDVTLSTASVDNSSNGTLVAQRDLTLDSVDALNNTGGTTYATRNLSFRNGSATLDNTGGQLGAGDTAWLNLAQITNNTGGHLQASTLWLTTPTLTNDGGEVDGAVVHAIFASLNGIGRLYGSQLLDAHVTGDYAHLAGQRLESDGVLSLTVDGTLTNQGTLQTQGELDLSAANLINTNGAMINASANDGSGVANIHVSGNLDNQQGATLEGDTLNVSVGTLTNTGNIVGDVVNVDASTLTNGRDLGSATAAVDYGEGFIGASQALNLHVGTLANLDAQLYSGGNLSIAADAAGNRAQSVLNRSGLIQAEGDLNLAAQQITNERRLFETGWVTLTPAEQAQNSTTTVDPQYRYTDTDPAHQPPNIDPSQVVDASELAKAQAYCDSHNWASLRCIGYPQGKGSPAVFQSDTTTTVIAYEVVTAESAASLMVSGGDMHLSGSLRNDKSTVAAGHDLIINAPGTDVTGTETVENIAWAPTAQLQTTTDLQTQSQYLVTSPSRTWLDGDWWTYDTQTATSSVLLAPGQVPGWITLNAGPGVKATLTAGGAIYINGADVTNRYGGTAPGVSGSASTPAVGGSGGASGITAGGLADPGSTTFQNANGAQAGAAAGVASASGTAVHGAGAAGAAQGQSVSGPGHQSGATGQTIGDTHSPLPGYIPPNNAMVQQHPDADAPFLITTAPRFAKGASTSSDYLLRALGDDSANVHKRLGDGYYEQNLVMDQILQLTGRRSVNGGDPMAQYGALMDGAAAEAARLGLSLGAPLTTAQIAALDTDIVWLVDQVVDGQHVLVPVVYLSKATADRMKSDGALIAGDTVNVASSGTLRNDGTISGTQGTWLSADTLINTGALKSNGTLAIATRNDTINTGTLSGGTVSVAAGRDLRNTGSITSNGNMALTAGRDLTTGVAPIQAGGNLAMVAGRNLTATASKISAVGDAQLVAGNNLTLNATGHTTRTGGASNGQESTTHAVTAIQAGGNLALVAGNDLTSTGAQLSAGNQLGLAAGHDLTLNAVTDHQATYSKTVSGHTVTTTRADDDTVRGSSLSGTNGVALTANHDLTATSATITSANGNVGLMAGHDLTLNTAQENHSTVTDTKTTSSGLLSSSTKRTHDSVSDSLAIGTTISGSGVSMAAGHDLAATAAQVVADHDIVMVAGNNLTLNTANDVHTEDHSTSKTKSGLMGAGVGVMVGQAKQSQDATLTQTTPTGTTVGSLGGSVTMSAGNNVHLTNATVLSDTGTAIVGKNVTIDAALGATDTTQTQKQSSSGLTLSLGGAAVTAAQGVVASAKRGSEVKDDRLKALYAAQAGYAAYDTVQSANAIANGSNGNSAINLQLGIGGSSASSKTVTHDETAYGSTIQSNGNVVIAATGGDLNVIGSQISGDNVGLMAANNINLLSQAEDHTLKNTNKNASGGVGVQIGSDGIGFYAQASVGKGSAHGNGTTHATTSVDATDTLTLISGGDTTIQGAQAKGNTVLADIGGNLNIRSEQDTDDYASKQQQASGKVVVGMGASASGSYNQSNIDSHYASVTTVSGIGAGDGGFDIHVKGNTDLHGGVIASTADANKNLLDTGSLTFSNIENKADYSASSVGIGAGTGGGSIGGPPGIAPGIGVPQSDSSRSTTKAGIAQGTITVRSGNADLSALDRTATLDQQGLKPIFDLQKVQEQQEMGQVAGYVGMRTAGSIADYMANHATTDAEQKSWQDGGANKVLLHGLVGAGTAALGNGDVVGGAVGAAASEAASAKMQEYLDSQHITDPAQRNTLMNLASAAIGGAAGGGAGAATALQGEQFNRQLHETEKQRIKQLAGGDPQREADLSAASCALVHCSTEYAKDSPEYAYYSQLEALGNQPQYADDRALLSQQTYTRTVVIPSGMSVPVADPLFDYSAGDKVLDNLTYVNNSYGHPFTRAGGALQAVGGAASAATGTVLAAGGAAACPESLGAGCGVAVGGTALAVWGVDQTQAGVRTAWNGAPTQTIGGYVLQQAFGISPQAAELLYGAVGVAGGMSLGSVNVPSLSTVKVYAPAASATADAEAGGISRWVTSTDGVMLDGAVPLSKDALSAMSPDMAYKYLLTSSDQLNVASSPNAAVFYSGPGARTVAETFALSSGKTTLEMTPGGAWLDNLQLFSGGVPGITQEQALNLWVNTSSRYANCASGVCIGILNNPRPTSIFNTVEFPILQKNPNVTNVITGGN
ncbi:hemagglutinin repeat-containing protein [Dyella japonica]|uniref:hemagglutinin repeat-containing protein n=1 Tax=Dyella japonica TaxID=231455 RepID=UPI00069C9DCD|nr:hemagglutinin repeat-containing protein [Dyella japonica]